jgi:hypothetical protein
MSTMRKTTAKALVLGALLLATVAVRTTDAQLAARSACGLHVGSAPISDPDPVDCPFCGGNPQTHLRAFWAIQKEIARACHFVLL